MVELVQVWYPLNAVASNEYCKDIKNQSGGGGRGGGVLPATMIRLTRESLISFSLWARSEAGIPELSSS